MVVKPSVVAAIIERIAEREGIDATDLDSRLYDVIDVDALETLVASVRDRPGHVNLRVTFTFHGYVVNVEGSGEVVIEEGPATNVADGSSRGRAVGN